MFIKDSDAGYIDQHIGRVSVDISMCTRSEVRKHVT